MINKNKQTITGYKMSDKDCNLESPEYTGDDYDRRDTYMQGEIDDRYCDFGYDNLGEDSKDRDDSKDDDFDDDDYGERLDGDYLYDDDDDDVDHE